jgi:hypothetical protein
MVYDALRGVEERQHGCCNDTLGKPEVMNQLEHLRAMSPGEAISAIAADLASGGSTYASVGANELLKACGVEVAEGSLSIVWVDMPLSEAEDLANFVYELESKVTADRWIELQGLLAKHEEGELELTEKDFQGDEWVLMEAAYNLEMQSCIECDRIYNHDISAPNGTNLRFRFVVSWVGGEIISARSPYDFRGRR